MVIMIIDISKDLLHKKKIDKLKEAFEFPERREDIFHHLLEHKFFPEEGGEVLLIFFLSTFLKLGIIGKSERDIILGVFEGENFKLPPIPFEAQFNLLMRALGGFKKVERGESCTIDVVDDILEICEKETENNINLFWSIGLISAQIFKKNELKILTRFLYILLISHLREK